jgi:hypothetical protein
MAYISPSITPSGTTFAQFHAGGASGHLEYLIAANLNGTQSPSVSIAPTVSVSGSGGSLALGTYHLVFTETNGLGETTASGESSPFTVAAGQVPTVTFPSLQSGNLARNVYLTPANGASGSELLYADGIVTGTYSLSAAAPTNTFAVAPPMVNTTGLTTTKLQFLRYAKSGNLQRAWDFLHQQVTTFNRGDPANFQSVVTKFRDAHTVFALLAQLCSEAGALIDANPGHFSNVPTGIGGTKTQRSWP